jgi:hypothetical protein
MNNLILLKKTIQCEEILTESIPMCNACLSEIKDGNFICKDCRINVCESHVEKHKNHNLLKLIKQ